MRQIVLLLLALVLFAGNALAEEDVHWTYSGEHGPEHWGELSKAFVTCEEGKSQSPIDIVDPIDRELDPIVFSYRGSTTAVVNNGHTLQIDVGRDNTLEVDGQTFKLLQFHLHSPSEHRIEGESFPLEIHFVHQNDRGERAAVSLLFRLGDRNRAMATIGAAAPDDADGEGRGRDGRQERVPFHDPWVSFTSASCAPLLRRRSPTDLVAEKIEAAGERRGG